MTDERSEPPDELDIPTVYRQTELRVRPACSWPNPASTAGRIQSDLIKELETILQDRTLNCLLDAIEAVYRKRGAASSSPKLQQYWGEIADQIETWSRSLWDNTRGGNQ